MRAFVALLVALAFFAIAQTPAPARTSMPPSAVVTEEEAVLLPFALVAHSPRQLDAWLPGGALANYVREGDIFYLVSGNNARTLDVSWVNESAARLKSAYPKADVFALTAGVRNVRTLAAGASADIRAIGYGYEPNMRNEPEFSWSRSAVAAAMSEVGDIVRASGRESFAMPTGRAMTPRDKRGAFGYADDIGRYVDRVFVQAQAHCQRHDFAEGVREIVGQFGDDAGRAWFQITVDPSEVNGVDARQATACVSRSLEYRPAGILFWWGSEDLEEARRFLGGRDAFVLP